MTEYRYINTKIDDIRVLLYWVRVAYACSRKWKTPMRQHRGRSLEPFVRAWTFCGSVLGYTRILPDKSTHNQPERVFPFMGPMFGFFLFRNEIPEVCRNGRYLTARFDLTSCDFD